MSIPNSWINKSLIELNVRKSYRVNIIGIKNNNEIKVDFDPAEALQDSDILLMHQISAYYFVFGNLNFLSLLSYLNYSLWNNHFSLHF